jgi:hypothetical protein
MTEDEEIDEMYEDVIRTFTVSDDVISTNPAASAPAHLSVASHLRLDRQETLIPVTAESAEELRYAVFRCAVYFRREMHFDFPQYWHQGRLPADPTTGNQFSAHLWAINTFERKHRVYGACCFEMRPESRVLMLWVWLHPYYRGKGKLGAVWPYFRQRYGQFELDRPLSPAMVAFLTRIGEAPDGRREGDSGGAGHGSNAT